MTADFNNTQPIYQQIISRILLAIAKGELPPGAKVKPVREMAADFKVNPNTMQKALAKLEEMGYMYTERTSGRFVAQATKLISELRENLPAEITVAYLEKMCDLGMEKSAIPAYLADFIAKTIPEGHNLWKGMG